MLGRSSNSRFLFFRSSSGSDRVKIGITATAVIETTATHNNIAINAGNIFLNFSFLVNGGPLFQKIINIT